MVIIRLVYPEILNFVFAAGVVFAVIYVTTPILYDMWFTHLRDQNTNPTLITAGDRFFQSWMLMGYIVPGIIIAYGFSVAARKRTRDDLSSEY